MESIDVDGTPFSVLMDRAVKLKTLQTKHQREKYDAWPSFYANSIFPHEEADAARQQSSFDDRLASAERIKEEGNAAFRDGRLSDALSKYEVALSVFRYLENTNPSWKTDGIKDSCLKEHCYEGEGEEERNQLNQFLVHCYNNIALVSYKMDNFSQAIVACDYAIAVEENDKSFYLRARARIAPKTSGVADQLLARGDLQSALKVNSQNKAAEKLLHKLNNQTKLQRKRDKSTFQGLFDRGEVYSAQELVEEKAARKVSAEQDRLESKDRDIVLGKQLRQLYEERGMEKEKQKIEQSLRQEEERAAAKHAYFNSLDFRNPSAEMIRDAKSHGVDLNDPQTVEVLEEMRKKHKSGRPIVAEGQSDNTGFPALSWAGMKYVAMLACIILVGWYAMVQ